VYAYGCGCGSPGRHGQELPLDEQVCGGLWAWVWAWVWVRVRLLVGVVGVVAPLAAGVGVTIR